LKNLSGLYTSTLGSGWAPVFYFGAFVVLFSTAFSALGAWTRQFSDAFGQIGIFDFSDLKKRRHWISSLALVIPVLWAVVFLLSSKPVWMVFIGGFVTSIILLVVLFAAFVFKRERQAAGMIPTGTKYEVAFWVSAAMILFVAALGVKNALGG
jgi:hypothetical protein